MRFRLIGAVLMLGLLAFLPPAAPAQAKKKPGKGTAPANVQDGAKLPSGEYKGILRVTPGPDRTFTLTIEKEQLVYTGKGNPGKIQGNNNLNQLLQAQVQLQRAQLEMQQARNPQQQRQATQHYQQAYQRYQQATVQANLRALSATSKGKNNNGLPPGYKLEINRQDWEFQHTEQVKVRTLVLAEEFDDKGKLKTYTAEEKAKLRGKDKHLPGYESNLEKLTTGQHVTITLASVNAKAKAKEKEDDEVGDKRMQTRLIVITAEADPSSKPRGKKK